MTAPFKAKSYADGLKDAAMICRRAAQRHADETNKLRKEGKILSAVPTAHRANEAKLLEEAIRALEGGE